MNNKETAQNFIDSYKIEEGVQGSPFSEQLELNLVAGITELLDKEEHDKSQLIVLSKELFKMISATVKPQSSNVSSWLNLATKHFYIIDRYNIHE